MGLVGPNGKDIDLSKGQIVGEDIKKYRSGDVEIATADTPETMLLRALDQVRGFMAQQGNMVAAGNATPFQVEPCALAVFMMLCTEVKRLNGEIEQLKKGKSDGNANDGKSVRTVSGGNGRTGQDGCGP